MNKHPNQRFIKREFQKRINRLNKRGKQSQFLNGKNNHKKDHNNNYNNNCMMNKIFKIIMTNNNRDNQDKIPGRMIN